MSGGVFQGLQVGQIESPRWIFSSSFPATCLATSKGPLSIFLHLQALQYLCKDSEVSYHNPSSCGLPLGLQAKLVATGQHQADQG